MKKIEFGFHWGIQSIPSKEIFEYEDDVTDEEIQQDFEDWIWNEIGDRVWMEEVE